MGKQFEIEVTMDTGHVFTFLVDQSRVVRDSHIVEYLEKEVARERAKKRRIPGCVKRVVNRTMNMVQSKSRVHSPWYG